MESYQDQDQEVLDVLRKHGFLQYVSGDKQWRQLHVFLTNVQERINSCAPDQNLLLDYTGSDNTACSVQRQVAKHFLIAKITILKTQTAENFKTT